MVKQKNLCVPFLFLQVSIYGHSLGSVLSYDILCHQEFSSAPFPVDYMNMEVSSDEGHIAKSPDTVTAHESVMKEQDTSSISGHSCADNVNDVVDEGSTRTGPSCTEDTTLPTCALENSPKLTTDALPTAVDGEQIEVEKQVDNHKIACSEEGDNSSVRAKDIDSCIISRSAEGVHADVPDKDTLISSLKEEVWHYQIYLTYNVPAIFYSSILISKLNVGCLGRNGQQ